MIKSYELAKQMAGVSCLALQGMLPRVRSIAFIDQSVIWNDVSDTVKFLASGYLPSGKQYDVPLELKPLQRMREQHWLDSDELHNELNKVVQAFNVAVALDGMMGERIPLPHASHPFKIAERSMGNGRKTVFVTLRAWIPVDTHRLVTKLTDKDHGINMLHFSNDTSGMDLGLSGYLDYEIGPLPLNTEYELYQLRAITPSGQGVMQSSGLRFRTGRL